MQVLGPCPTPLAQFQQGLLGRVRVQVWLRRRTGTGFLSLARPACPPAAHEVPGAHPGSVRPGPTRSLPYTRVGVHAHTHPSNAHFSPGCVQWLWEGCGALGDMASVSPRLLGHPHSITPALGGTTGTLDGPQETKGTTSGGRRSASCECPWGRGALSCGFETKSTPAFVGQVAAAHGKGMAE